MAKLTSEQRRNLPDDMFGLPDERAYPMPDASHVSRAITYFGSCSVKKRATLAKNINRFAKLYKMTVKLSSSSVFKPYADKSIVSESADIITENVIPREVEKIILTEATVANYTDSRVRGINNPRIDSSINVAIRNAAKNYLDKEYYVNGGKDRTEIGDYVYDTDLKLCYDITRDFIYSKSIDDPELLKKIGLIHNKEMLTNAFNNVNNLMRKSPVVGSILNDITDAIDKVPQTSLLDNMDNKMKNLDSDFDKSILQIDSDMVVGHVQTRQSNFNEKEIDDIKNNEDILTKLVCTCQLLLSEKFGYPAMSNDDLYRLDFSVKAMAQRNIIDGYYITDDNRCFVKMKRAIYGVVHECKTNKECKCVINLLKLFDEDKPDYLHQVHSEYIIKQCVLPKMPIRRVCFPCKPEVDADKQAFLEGIHISSLGDISLMFDISKSFMDRYSACHQMLKNDEKNKNYDSMKHDVAYLFALVCTIEDQYIGKDKSVDVNSAEYKDAIKARAFAKNDIKRNISIIQQHDRSFKFMKFYTDNDYDKKIFTVRHTTIAGLKNLFRIIMA